VIKFIHKVIFTWIWVCTWVNIASTALFVFGGVAFVMYLLFVPNPWIYEVPFKGLGLFLGLIGYILLCLAAGFIHWVFTTTQMLMLAYYTRPQAWPEHHGPVPEWIEEPSFNAGHFSKAIYAR
jgi:hypothetical protein